MQRCDIYRSIYLYLFHIYLHYITFIYFYIINISFFFKSSFSSFEVLGPLQLLLAKISLARRAPQPAAASALRAAKAFAERKLFALAAAAQVATAEAQRGRKRFIINNYIDIISDTIFIFFVILYISMIFIYYIIYYILYDA